MTSSASLKTILHDAGITASPTQLDQLTRYRELVSKWNPRQNMVAPSTLLDFDRRHVLDSAQVARFIPTDAQTLLDIGSGAGLPGLVLAVLQPDLEITLAEIIQKKASFLTTAAYELGLKNVRVHAADVRTLAPQKFNLITARAVTNLADLLDLSEALLATDGRWLLLKGQAVEQEINALENSARLAITQYRSIVDPAGAVLEIKQLKQAS